MAATEGDRRPGEEPTGEHADPDGSGPDLSTSDDTAPGTAAYPQVPPGAAEAYGPGGGARIPDGRHPPAADRGPDAQGADPQGAYAPAGFPRDPHAPAGYPQGAYAPGGYPWDPYAPAGYPQGAYAPGGYPPQGAYPQGPYARGAAAQGPFPQGPFPQGPYGGPGPYPPVAHTPPRWGLKSFVLVELVFLAASLLLGIALIGQGPPTVGVILAVTLLPQLLAAGVALAITQVAGNGPRRDIGLVWSWRDLGVGLAFGFGGLFLTTAAAAIFVAIVGPDVSSAVGDVFEGVRAGPVAAVMVLLAVVVVVPICEEILFRGMLWSGLERLGANRWWAFAITTVVFALLHFEFTRAPLLLVISIPIGLARLYTGRLLAGIVAHQINNLLPGIALMLMLLGVPLGA